jgi:hypothetical protein
MLALLGRDLRLATFDRQHAIQVGVKVGMVDSVLLVLVVVSVVVSLRTVGTIMAVVMVGGLPGKDLRWIDDQGRLAWLGLAHLVANTVAVFTVFSCPDPLDVVVMTFLNGADFSLKAEYLCPVFAHLAVHGDVTGQDLVNALRKRGDNLRMIVKVGRLDEFDLRMTCCNGVRCIINAIDEDAGEEEIGEHHDAAVAEASGMLEAGINQGEVRMWFARGKLIAALKKFPAEGDFRVLIDQGSRIEAHYPTLHEQEIALEVGSSLRDQGIALAAIDFIDGKISDYNITSPGLLVQLEKVHGGRNFAAEIIKAIL